MNCWFIRRLCALLDQGKRGWLLEL